MDMATQAQTLLKLMKHVGFPASSADQESASNAGDPSSIPGSEDSLEKG